MIEFVVLSILMIAAIFLTGYSFGYSAAMKWNIEYDKKHRRKT
jgi:hypothetical protein